MARTRISAYGNDAAVVEPHSLEDELDKLRAPLSVSLAPEEKSSSTWSGDVLRPVEVAQLVEA